jgi:hypothetical protein
MALQCGWFLYRGADCNRDHYLMVAEERLSVSKSAAQKYDVERF